MLDHAQQHREAIRPDDSLEQPSPLRHVPSYASDSTHDAPLCRFGQGDYTHDYDPQPPACAREAVTGTARLVGGVCLFAAGVVAGGVAVGVLL